MNEDAKKVTPEGHESDFMDKMEGALKRMNKRVEELTGKTFFQHLKEKIQQEKDEKR